MLAGWEVLDAATAQRKRLLKTGYLPIPVCGKAPAIPGWSDIHATEDIVDSWVKLYPNARSTGILTRDVPTVDIDILDAEVAEEVEALLWDTIGTRTMVRFGRAPKRAVLFQCSATFKKTMTPLFTAPSGTKNKVEVLGNGQQVVVFGVHPDTGNEYSWHGGEPGTVARADLPELSETLAREFVAKAAAMLRAQQGWAEDTPTRNGTPSQFELMYGTDWQALVRDGAGEGSRNDSIARLTGHLLQRHVDPLTALELVLAFNDARCRPPLEHAEVIKTVDSIAALELKQRGTR
jgi:hypothetical protein